MADRVHAWIPHVFEKSYREERDSPSKAHEMSGIIPFPFVNNIVGDKSETDSEGFAADSVVWKKWA